MDGSGKILSTKSVNYPKADKMTHKM